MLDSVWIDEQGMCADCIEVRLQEELLAVEKEKLLEKYHGEGPRPLNPI